MSKIHLTAGIVRHSICPADRAKVDFFDASQRGFLLEVRRSGGKTYYQRFVDARGRTRQLRVGPADVLTLSSARQIAKRAVADALRGDDPKMRRDEMRKTVTLNEFVRDYYLPHVTRSKRSWKTDETILRIHVLPVLGVVFLDEIRGDAIERILTHLTAERYSSGTTNRVVIVLRHAFNLAIKWQIPFVLKNPTDGIRLAADVTRERFLSVDEARQLVAAIEADQNEPARRAIMLLLLTGARRHEITQTRWEHVNWQRKVLVVPLSKSGKSRAIALNDSALRLLGETPRIVGNPYIFPSSKTGRPCASLHFPWDRIRKRAGLLDFRLHDLRHSFASFLVNQGVSLYVVQGLLGHAHSRYTQRYAHLTTDTLVEAAERLDMLIAKA